MSSVIVYHRTLTFLDYDAHILTTTSFFAKPLPFGESEFSFKSEVKSDVKVAVKSKVLPWADLSGFRNHSSISTVWIYCNNLPVHKSSMQEQERGDWAPLY
jgi:hypothetical protein